MSVGIVNPDTRIRVVKKLYGKLASKILKDVDGRGEKVTQPYIELFSRLNDNEEKREADVEGEAAVLNEIREIKARIVEAKTQRVHLSDIVNIEKEEGISDADGSTP